MATFLIPKTNLKTLEKKIAAIRRKGASVIFDVGESQYVKRNVILTDKESGRVLIKPVVVDSVAVTVSGSYVIDGWEFVAVVDHTPKGNIIRTVDPSWKELIPEKYNTTSSECEHCNFYRNRKDTYLIYNQETKEFKQVGKSCLMEYTNGLHATTCAAMVDLDKYLRNIGNQSDFTDKDEIFESIKGSLYPSSNNVSSGEAKPTILGYVKNYGYTPKLSSGALREHFFQKHREDVENIILATEYEVNEMNKWVERLNPDSNYMRDAALAWQKDYYEYRDIALVASLCKVYLNTKFQQKMDTIKLSNEFVGEIGESVVISDIQLIRKLFTNVYHLPYEIVDVYFYEIIDNKGNIYTWSTQRKLNTKEVDVKQIKATVKNHTNYKGRIQTEITKGYVTPK